MSRRYKIEDGGDVPPQIAARRMGMSLPDFIDKLDALIGRGFPRPDPTTGNFDLDAIERWRKLRYPHLTDARLTLVPQARNASDVVRARLRGEKVG